VVVAGVGGALRWEEEHLWTFDESSLVQLYDVNAIVMLKSTVSMVQRCAKFKVTRKLNCQEWPPLSPRFNRIILSVILYNGDQINGLC